MIYFTSDLHLGHNNMLKFRDRPFENVEEMNEQLLKNINDICTKRDTLFILGDISYHQNTKETEEQLSMLNPQLILIRGNHDKQYKESLFAKVMDYCEIKVYHRKIVMSHYPFAEWNGSHNGAIHLHGHQHNYEDYNISMRDQGILRYDVGIDANHGMPVSVYDIFRFFDLDIDVYNNGMKQAVNDLIAKR